MRRIYVLLLVIVMSLFNIIAYAEGGAIIQVSDIERIIGIVEGTLDEGNPVRVSFSGFSRQYYFTNRGHSIEYSELEAWTIQQKNDASQFLNGLSQYFSKESSSEEFENAGKDGTYHCNVGFSLVGKFFGHWSTKNIYSLSLRDQYLIIYNDFSESVYYKVDRPQELVEYIYKNGHKIDPTFKVYDTQIYRGMNIDFENKTYGTKNASFRVVEKLTFDVLVDDSYFETPIAEVAESGSIMHCTIEQFSIGNQSYLLSLEGNRGKKQLVKMEDLFTVSGQTSGHALEFSTNYLADGEGFYELRPVPRLGIIRFAGKSSASSVTNVQLQYTWQGEGQKEPTPLTASNVKYIFCDDESRLKGGVNLFIRFGIGERDVEIAKMLEESKDEAPPQDPERYITEMRGEYLDGAEIIDFYIDFAANTKLNLSGRRVPEWYKALGNDVTVTLIGITQTLNGKDRMSYPMLRFKGNRGTQWFEVSTTAPSDKLAIGDYQTKEDLSVDMTFHSLISFEGFTKIRNTVEYETMSLNMKLSNDGLLAMEQIEFNINGIKTVIKENEFNYIGGGSESYEKLW